MGPAVGLADYRFRIRLTNLADAAFPEGGTICAVIVGKWAQGRYLSEARRTSCLKIKNPEYSQMEGRHELLEARRHRGMSRAKPAPLSFELA